MLFCFLHNAVVHLNLTCAVHKILQNTVIDFTTLILMIALYTFSEEPELNCSTGKEKMA